MMKKLIMLLTICMMCLLAVSASAAEKNDEAPPINWEISMMPKPTAEETRMKWNWLPPYCEEPIILSKP